VGCATWGVPHGACNAERGTRNAQRATPNVGRATRNVVHVGPLGALVCFICAARGRVRARSAPSGSTARTACRALWIVASTAGATTGRSATAGASACKATRATAASTAPRATGAAAGRAWMRSAMACSAAPTRTPGPTRRGTNVFQATARSRARRVSSTGVSTAATRTVRARQWEPNKTDQRQIYCLLSCIDRSLSEPLSASVTAPQVGSPQSGSGLKKKVPGTGTRVGRGSGGACSHPAQARARFTPGRMSRSWAGHWHEPEAGLAKRRRHASGSGLARSRRGGSGRWPFTCEGDDGRRPDSAGIWRCASSFNGR
jgi:hypothetical protein